MDIATAWDTCISLKIYICYSFGGIEGHCYSLRYLNCIEDRHLMWD